MAVKKKKVKAPIVEEVVKTTKKDQRKRTLAEIRAVLSLLNSVIKNNEQHNESSIKMFNLAIKSIDSLM